MIKLTWTSFDDADCDEFRIYRSVCGFVLSFPLSGAVIGSELKVQATSPFTQSVVLSSDSAIGVASDINNTLKGVKATVSDSGTEVIVRVTATDSNRKLKILPCSFCTETGLSPRIILTGSEWELVGSVPRVNDEFEYEYEDVDGDFFDLYRVASVKGSTESLPSLIRSPFITLPALCALEGRLISHENRPYANVVVRARSYIPGDCEDGAFISGSVDVRTVRTDVYGRFALNLLQKHVYLLEIPALGYNEVIEVPEAAWGRLVALPSTSKHWFSPGAGDPI